MNGLKITAADVPNFLRYIASKGQVFGAVVGKKRTNGERRTFNGRMEEIDEANNLCVIAEQNSGGYRSINLDSLESLSAFGERFTFDRGVPRKIHRLIRTEK